MYCNKLLILFLCLVSINTSAQSLSKDQIDTCRVFKSMEEALVHPEKVYVLDLKKSKLKVVPDGLEKLVNLNKLVLSKNKLDKLPESITKLPHLQIIDISKNNFDVLPAQICRCTGLIELNMSVNNIEGFPACIGNLSKLEYIDAFSNNLMVFPPEMAQLTQLREMDLRVISIPDEIQKKVYEMLPNTKLRFSADCGCGY